jgi:hypothetical protein
MLLRITAYTKDRTQTESIRHCLLVRNLAQNVTLSESRAPGGFHIIGGDFNNHTREEYANLVHDLGLIKDRFGCEIVLEVG